MQKPLIILWIRRNKDYYVYGKIQGYAYSRKDGIPESTSGRLESISRWNSVFKIPYIEFRKELRRIAEESYSLLNVDRIYLWNDEEEFSNLPEGSWVFPVDEDDWIDPKIFNEAVDNIHIYNDKKIVYCYIYKKDMNGKITYFTSKRDGTSFGYFIKTPCCYASISHHYIEKETKANENFIKIQNIIGMKIENISSLSLFKHHKFIHFIFFAKSELNRDIHKRGYEKQLSKYKNLLQKVLKYDI